MAQRTQVVLTDNIDGSEAEETVRFGLYGTEYEIDLSKQHADQLAAAIEPYIRSPGASVAPAAPARVLPGTTAPRQPSGSGRALRASRCPTAGGYRPRS